MTLRGAFERVIAALGLLLLSPLLLAVALVVVLDSPGNPFYRARRIGRNGEPFRMWKFRTMRADADRMGPPITGRNDPRLLRSGVLLRRAKLDELPQLLNVLTGQMSLIGPRPEAPQIVALYTPEQRAVLAVKPGITGKSQVTAGEESDRIPTAVDAQEYYVQHMMDRKLRLDLEYLRSRTLRSDFAVLLATARLLFRSLIHIF